MRGVLSSGGGSERSAQHLSWCSAAQTLREPILAWELGGHVQLFSVIVCPLNCKWKLSYHYDASRSFDCLRKSASVEIRWTVSALNRDRSVTVSHWCAVTVTVSHCHCQSLMRQSLVCLPHFDVFSDLLLHRPAATWNLFVLFDKEAKFVDGDSIYASILW